MSIKIENSAVSWAVAAVEQITSIRHKPVGLRETAGSFVTFLALPGEKRPAYCLKVRKAVRSTPSLRRKASELPPALEYKMMSRVHKYYSRFPEFSDSTPRPVQLSVEHNAILSEYAGGGSLREKLPWWGNAVTSARNIRNLRRVSEKCGAWLRLLHKMKPPDWLPAHYVDCEILKNKTLEAAASLPECLRREIPIGDLLDEIRGLNLGGKRLVVSHGDFQSGNILVSGLGITIVDLATARVCPIEDDLSFFIALLFTQKERIVYGSLPGTAAFPRELSDAFLSGYGFPPGDGWHQLGPMLKFHVVERLAEMCARIERFPAVFRPFLVRRVVDWVRSKPPLLFGWK